MSAPKSISGQLAKQTVDVSAESYYERVDWDKVANAVADAENKACEAHIRHCAGITSNPVVKVALRFVANDIAARRSAR